MESGRVLCPAQRRGKNPIAAAALFNPEKHGLKTASPNRQLWRSAAPAKQSEPRPVVKAAFYFVQVPAQSFVHLVTPFLNLGIMNSSTFYQDLPPLKLPLVSLFNEAHFTAVPADWQVIISDVKNSTQAVAVGRHNDVNLVAAGSLIAGLNVAKRHKTEVPFFFGGDGSTLLVPERLHAETMAGLAAHNRNVTKNFGLEMHIGSMPVGEVLANGQMLKLARLEIDSVYSKAIAIGNGLRFAEQKIKQTKPGGPDALQQAGSLDLNGLECRWNKVKPPREEAENNCYLIEAVEPEKQLQVYTDVFAVMEEIYGDLQKRCPLCMEQLKPLYSWKKLKKEMLLKFGESKLGYFLEAFLRTLFGVFAFRYNWDIGGVRGKEYLAQLIAHADTLTIDGRITTIICGTPDQHNRFLAYLEQGERKGLLLFGHHVSKESIMTCYIENRNARHVHFVDGADGGYTEASKELKSKLRNVQVVG